VSWTPVADHGLLSDCHSVGLVDRSGSVEWLVFPRFDGPSVFGRLLDEGAGHFAVRPTGAAETTRRYVEGTLVLETTFVTGTGTLVLRHALTLDPAAGGHRLGRAAPRLLVREAADFFAFITAAATGSLGRDGELQVVFGVGGERDLTERELPHLAGWRGSRPVRTSHAGLVNAAWAIAEAERRA